MCSSTRGCKLEMEFILIKQSDWKHDLNDLSVN